MPANIYRTNAFGPALPPRLVSGGFALFANGTGVASFDSFRVTQYPDPSVALLNAGRAANSLINYNGNIPANTSVAVQTSTDNGVTWQANAGGGAPIAGISTQLLSTLALQKKPIAYYHLTESASPSLDSTGNGYNGTWHGTITPGQVGPLQGPGELGNTALLFDGSTGYISTGAIVTAGTDFAISLWVNVSSFAVDGGGLQRRILVNNIDGTNAFQLATQAAGTLFVWAVNDSTGQVISSHGGFSTGVWYHIVGTWTAATRTTTLYVNGIAYPGNDGGATGFGIGTTGFNIARRTDSTGYFPGLLAEVAIFNPTAAASNADLVASDVFALYNRGLSGIGQVANDSFTANTSSSYTQTTGSGGAAATWTWDTVNSRVSAVGGSKAVLLYNSLWAYDTDILADFLQAENSGIVWGWQNNQNYYELVLKDSGANSGANTLTLNKVSGGTSTQLATAAVNFPTQTHHRLHLTMLSGVITASLDENQILTYTDGAPFPAGLAGLRNDTGTSYCYLLQITPQPVSVASQYLCVKHSLTTSDPTVTPQITDHQGLVSDSTLGTGVLIPQADFRQTYVSDNIDNMNQQSNYWWQVGSGIVTFQPRNAKNAPWVMQSTDILIGTLPRVEYSGDMYRNRQTLKGVFNTSTFSQTFVGDGQSKTWNVANPVQAMPTILLNGLPVSAGIQGVDSGKAYYYQLNSTAITQDNSQATLRKNIDVLSVAYLGAYGIDFSLDNTGQISGTISQAQMAATDGTSGIVEALEDVSSQGMNLAAATTYANQLFARYGSIARTITFQTLHPGLKAGHSLTIFVPQLNIFDSVFLVVEVSTSARLTANGVQYVYTCVASEAAALSSWVKYFSKVLRSVTGTKAKV